MPFADAAQYSAHDRRENTAFTAMYERLVFYTQNAWRIIVAEQEQIIEILRQKQITRIDKLTIGQRLLVQAMIGQVKNGHNYKITYHLCLKSLKKMRRKYFWLMRENYTFERFSKDLKEMSTKKIEYYNEEGELISFSWLQNLGVNIRYENVRYNLPKKLSNLYIQHDGQKFILFLCDFMELEDKHAQRLFRFLSGCKNTLVTCHKLSDLISYFEVPEISNADIFLSQVIEPAMQEITEKSLFSFRSLSAQVVKKDEQEYIEINFVPTIKKYLPRCFL